MTLTLEATLKAGSKPVICLSVDNTGHQLASSAEDGCVRVWDLATFKVKHAFLASCFDGETVTCIRWQDKGLLVSAGTSLFRLDNPIDASLFVKKATFSWPNIASEEINSFIYLPGSDMAVLGDDSGDISLLQFKTGQCEKVGQGQSHAHICTSLTLLALVSEQETTLHILSGGMDSLIKQWAPAFPREKDDTADLPPLQLISTLNAAAHQDPNAPQLFNPPYVQALASHSRLPMYAAGLGDGSVLVARHALVRSKHKNKRLNKRVMRHTWTTIRLTGHTLPVGAVCIIEDATLESREFSVVSGSSDCTVKLWRIREDEQGQLSGLQNAEFSLPCAEATKTPKINCITSIKQNGITKLLVGDVLGQISILQITG